jgi:hypothetical protein
MVRRRANCVRRTRCLDRPCSASRRRVGRTADIHSKPDMRLLRSNDHFRNNCATRIRDRLFAVLADHRAPTEPGCADLDVSFAQIIEESLAEAIAGNPYGVRFFPESWQAVLNAFLPRVPAVSRNPSDFLAGLRAALDRLATMPAFSTPAGQAVLARGIHLLDVELPGGRGPLERACSRRGASGRPLARTRTLERENRCSLSRLATKREATASAAGFASPERLLQTVGESWRLKLSLTLRSPRFCALLLVALQASAACGRGAATSASEPRTLEAQGPVCPVPDAPTSAQGLFRAAPRKFPRGKKCCLARRARTADARGALTAAHSAAAVRSCASRVGRGSNPTTRA